MIVKHKRTYYEQEMTGSKSEERLIETVKRLIRKTKSEKTSPKKRPLTADTYIITHMRGGCI